jgi:Antibiotic biosynthesis monooxygenase
VRLLSNARIVGEADVIGIIFEVWPADGKKQEYLDIAARLRPLLDEIDGFISIERFESLYEPGKILSLVLSRQCGSGTMAEA